ncbi:uncharacterized protein [Arachis hypogaea]|uniref:uncharacterized protein isoform X1 n=2 Tax=Arachis hypogaea TaxID=3818 RepID=UPI003B227791
MPFCLFSDNFLEGLLINGWLLKLTFLCGHIEKPVAIWSFNTMLYSLNEELRNSSSDFWRAILSSRKEVDQLPVEIGLFPEYSDLRTALDTYGFLFEFSSSGEPKNLDSDTGEPPQNIRAWLKFVTACCLIWSKRPVFSVVEAEELIEIIICLFLDRQFQGLLVLLNDCVEAIVNYFTDQEWHSSCENIEKFIASRYFLAEIEGPEQKSDSETKKDCRCCWILTSLHSKWIFWSYRSPIGALSTALESRHPGLSSNI